MVCKERVKGKYTKGYTKHVTARLKPIAILGAGAWGTALGLYLSRRGQTVHLWSQEAAEIAALLADKANTRYLPGHVFPKTLQPIANLVEAIKNVDDVLIAIPSAGFRKTLVLLKSVATSPLRMTCATKGLDAKGGQLLHEIAANILGNTFPYAVLSGPSFATEVATGLPTAVVIASKQPDFATDLQQRFHSALFQVQLSKDVIGVEIGGVVKNVIAIAVGIADGMQLGANTRSALITHGLTEMMQLGIALGGKQETFIGLSGMGDLILTCSDNQSRNRRLGLALGKGLNAEETEREIGQAVEGKQNVAVIVQLAKKHGIHMPIAEAVWDILQGQLKATEMLSRLFSD